VTPTGAAPPGDQQRPRERATPEILIRLASACILAALALAAVLASAWTFLVLVIVGGGILAWEWARLTRGDGRDFIASVGAASVAAVGLLVVLGRPQHVLVTLAIAAVVVVVASYRRTSSAWSLAGLAYVALPTWALVWLRSDPDFGIAAILFLFAVAWSTDTASYLGGRALGGPKLAPQISPKKTWAGFIVGTVAPGLVGYAFALLLGGTSVWFLALVSVVLAFACQIGDLIESAVKRHFGTKDMSQLIPGHGGLFDRVDGLLVTAVAAGLFALRNIDHPGAGLLIW
jgi:phosphatidate cytidylyltransferase